MRAKTRQKEKLLLHYLQERLSLMLMVLCLFLMFFSVLWLYQVDLSIPVYATLLCLLPLGLGFVLDYARYSARHRLMKGLMQGLPESLAALPPARGLAQADDLRLIERLDALRQEGDLAMQAQQRAQRRYYTHWSHQAKTPLSAMRLLLQGEDARSRQLSMELKKAERYVDMALTYTRLDNQASDLRFERLLLKGEVAGAARGFAAQFVEKRLSLENLVPGNQYIISDRKWLGFILEQLLGNAVKYTQTGGVVIRFEADARRLLIEDSGPGIPREDLPRVCELGYTGFMGRLSPQASGIGLYLVKESCKLCGIGFEIFSTVGKGTVLALSFPEQI